jgi:hypothetical protein
MLHDCPTAECQSVTCGSETEPAYEFECIKVYAEPKAIAMTIFHSC